MISERVLSTIIKNLSQQHLELEPTAETPARSGTGPEVPALHARAVLPEAVPGVQLNRYPFRPEIAAPYFASMRKVLMLKDLGYDFESVYVGGGTPTIMIDSMRDDRFGARDVLHQGGFQRDEPEPPGARVPAG